jgi:hypothetical protein
MPLSSDTRRPVRIPDDGSELTPLVTDEARGFLEGKISAEDYSEFVRRHAAREAGRNATFSVAAKSRSTAVVAFLAFGGYAVAGAVLSSSKEVGVALLAALGSGVIAGAAVVLVYESLYRRK